MPELKIHTRQIALINSAESNLSAFAQSFCRFLLEEADGDAAAAYKGVKDHIAVIHNEPEVLTAEVHGPEFFFPIAEVFLTLIQTALGCLELADASPQKRSGWKRSRIGRSWLDWILEERRQLTQTSMATTLQSTLFSDEPSMAEAITSSIVNVNQLDSLRVMHNILNEHALSDEDRETLRELHEAYYETFAVSR